VRAVCLLVNGNVLSCDHVIQNHNGNRNDKRPSVVVYESVFRRTRQTERANPNEYSTRWRTRAYRRHPESTSWVPPIARPYRSTSVVRPAKIQKRKRHALKSFILDTWFTCFVTKTRIDPLKSKPNIQYKLEHMFGSRFFVGFSIRFFIRII